MTHVLFLGGHGQLDQVATDFFPQRTDAHLTLCLRQERRLRLPTI